MVVSRKLVQQVDGLTFATLALLGVSLVLAIVSGLIWWNFVYLRDSHVFWGAVDNALATPGVTRVWRVEQGADKQLERVSLNFHPVLNSAGYSQSETAGGFTTSESVATKSQDFARYTRLEQRSTDSKKDISKIENVWVDTYIPANKESKLLGDHLTNGLLVFVGDLPHDTRAGFVSSLRGSAVFSVIGKSRTEVIGGKKASVYKIELDITAYNKALAEYLNILGLPMAAGQVGVSADSSRPTFEIAIVPATRAIVKVGYPDLSAPGAELFGSWGVSRKIDMPTEFITTDELQKRINGLQAS